MYISKKKIEECKKEGGILPLLTLIPLIAGGVGAAGAVAGGAAGIAKAVHDKKAQDAELAEEKRHNREMEKAVKGRGIKEPVEIFLQATDLDNNAKKAAKKIIKILSGVFPITPDKEGNELILRIGKGLTLNPWK